MPRVLQLFLFRRLIETKARLGLPAMPLNLTVRGELVEPPRDGVCYPVTHVFTDGHILNHVETYERGNMPRPA